MKFAIWSKKLDRPDETKEFPDTYIKAPGFIEAYLKYIKDNIPDDIQTINVIFHLCKFSVPAIKFIYKNYLIMIAVSNDNIMTIEKYVEYLTQEDNHGSNNNPHM